MHTSCKHEVEFGTYSVITNGLVRVTTLQRCSECGTYFSLDGREFDEASVLSRESVKRDKMRTVTAHISNDLYDRLIELAEGETGGDLTKIMNEVVALGLKNYHRQLKAA